MLIIFVIVLAILSIIFYNVPVIGTILCLIGLALGLKVAREKNLIFGLLVMFLNFILTVLSVIILLVTFNVMQQPALQIGYKQEYTNIINGMFMKDLDIAKEEIQGDINSYINKITMYSSNEVTKEQAAAQLFMDSSDVTIYYSSSNADRLKEDMTEDTYNGIKDILALKDKEVSYYLINFDKLYETIEPIRKVEEDKIGFWLMDKDGNVYLNIQSAKEYIYSK
jgi:hypothetical protein